MSYNLKKLAGSLGLITVVAIMTAACGVAHKDKKADAKKNNGVITSSDFFDFGTINLSQVNSKNPLHDKSGNVFGVSLDGGLIDDSHWHYDADTKQSKLLLSVSAGLTSDETVPGVVFGHTKQLLSCAESQYIYTTFDINQLTKSNYDPNGAKIYLQIGTRSIEIGQYRTPKVNDNEDTRLGIFQSPVLCEGKYEDICQLSLQAAPKTNSYGPTIAGAAAITLSNTGVEKSSYTATTPIEGDSDRVIFHQCPAN